MRHSLAFTLFKVVSLGLVVTLAGCVTTELQVTNLAADSIQFYSGHTKQAVVIPAGATVAVPHPAGTAIVIGQRDEVWTYQGVDFDDFTPEPSKASNRQTLAMSVQPDGTILLPSGGKIEPSHRIHH